MNLNEQDQQLALAASSWPPEERERLLTLLDAVEDSMMWARHCTRTKDEQDPMNPYKPLPSYRYFDFLHSLWMREPMLFVEKSRSMMVTWWGAIECLHYVMTHQPATCIFWAQDEDRSVKCLDYCWTLYEQQWSELQDRWPVVRPRTKQAYNRMEFKSGGWLLALPGKDPNKIRSEHPTILMMDEACFIERGGEAFDIAVSTRVPRMLVVSSAAPSWFRTLTEPAVPEEFESNTREA
jgi:hypothetical protein